MTSSLAGSSLSTDELIAVSAMSEIGEGSELLAACEHILRSGGKRLRPRLVLAASMTGCDPTAPAVRHAAVAVELLHSASLAHDDVIDDASARRGQDTVGMRFGATTAALAGGWLFGRSAALVSRCGDDAMLRYSAAAANVCDGQMLEICDLFDSTRSEARYLEAIGGKTATLFELCTTLGAELASADRPTVEKARECGWRFGIAFQVLDDVRDLLVSESVTGKAIGKDILQGVYTLPVIYAIEDTPELTERLTVDLSRESLPTVLDEICVTAGPARAIEYATEHAVSARDAALDLPGGDGLADLVDEILITSTEGIL